MNTEKRDRHIDVRVKSSYLDDQSVPEANQYFFAYTVTISNLGEVAAKLKSRHWIVTDANGKTQEVKGEGVVGEQPHLEPGQHFNYTSGVMLETPVGSMHGSYQMVDSEGLQFDAEIPAFGLSIPHILH